MCNCNRNIVFGYKSFGSRLLTHQSTNRNQSTMNLLLFISLAIVQFASAQLEEKCVTSPDSLNPNFIKHQTNCSKFWSCGSGVYLEMECPARLHFNAVKKICDWPADAGCVSSNNNKVPPVADSDANLMAFPGDKCAQSKNRNSPRVAPFQNNCEKFLICSGVWTIMDCPVNLLFSVETGHCEHSHDAKCASSSNMTTTTQPQCLKEGKKTMNPTDCRKFFVCQNGTLVNTACPDGLLFSSARGECMLERGSSCGPLLTTASSLPLCPIDNVLYPNYEDCKKFFICNGGTLVAQSCPPHKVFSVRHNNCQFKMNAVCAGN